MNRAELTARIAQEHDMTKAAAGRVLETVFDAIMTTVKKGEVATFPGFGSFSRISRAARKGHNPATGEAIKIAAVKRPRFVAGSGFKALVDPKEASRKAARRA